MQAMDVCIGLSMHIMAHSALLQPDIKPVFVTDGVLTVKSCLPQ